MTTARASTFSALRGRNYLHYWLGLVCYVLGHRAEYVTFAWIVWEVTRDPLALAYLGLAQGVPLVVFQLFGGVMADRVNRLRLLIVTQILTALTLSVALVLTLLGGARLGTLLTLAALSNIFRAFDEPSRMSLVPSLIDRERLANAIALGSIPWQAGRMIGPSITGLLIAAFGGWVGFAMAAAGSYAALALYSRIRLEIAPRPPDGQRVLRQFTAGLTFVAGNLIFASLIGLSLFNSLFAMSYLTLLPIFADTYFGMGPTGYGLLQAAHGIGALSATFTVATVAPRIARRGPWLFAGAAALGFVLMGFAYAPHIRVAWPLLVLVGFCNTFYLTQTSTYLQQRVPDHLRGRVMSLYSLCWNLMPLGGLLAGVLAALVDARFAVLVGGGMVAANALLLFGSARLRAIR